MKRGIPMIGQDSDAVKWAVPIMTLKELEPDGLRWGLWLARKAEEARKKQHKAKEGQ